ncbi:MAG: efflux RND transporter periplasmic adaptor subunit [Tannerella sp.]|jgi:membrane fusion protein (multidrug efflux system)|nr:efflux RND transporter periplasmic adaptor subunit [Tannerella sp.]
MRKHLKWIRVGVVILLFVSGMILFPYVKNLFQSDNMTDSSGSGGSGGPPGVRQQRALNVNAVVMNYQSLVDNTRSLADILPDEEVDLSFEMSGKITNIFFSEGAHVEKGELLAKINDRPLQAQLLKLEAQLPLANSRVERQGTLLEKDAVSKEAFETVETELEKLLADIELVKANIAQTELRAPFDGIVGLRNVSEGAWTSPSTAITKLTKIKPVKIEFPIPEQYSEDIIPGTKIIFRLTGSLEDYHAQVYAVESKIDINTRGLRARAYYPNTNESIKPGRYASVELTKKEIKDALAVPSESIIQEMGRSIVYLYKSGGAIPAEIIPGLRTASQVQVVQGLTVGDTVIISGVMQLRTGLPVTIDNL